MPTDRVDLRAYLLGCVQAECDQHVYVRGRGLRSHVLRQVGVTRRIHSEAAIECSEPLRMLPLTSRAIPIDYERDSLWRATASVTQDSSSTKRLSRRASSVRSGSAHLPTKVP